MVRVVAKLEPGGAQLSLLRVSRALRARGIETRLLCGSADAPGLAIARDHGLTPEVYGQRGLQWSADQGFADWLRPRLAGADLVHAHIFGGWWAAARAIEPGIPLVASEHNPFTWPAEPQIERLREGLKRVDRFYAHGPNAMATVLAAGLPAGRLLPGISPVLGLDARPRPWLPASRLMYAGRLHEEKGPDVLLEALALLREPPVCFILGSGCSELSLRRRAAQEDLRGRIHFCGWRRDPAPWIAGASALVVPSRNEGWSQTAVLGMGLGVPVIGTAIDGLAQTLADERGIGVSPADPEALAGAISAVLSGERHTDLAGARHWARRFELEKVVAAYEATYRGLTAPPALGFAADPTVPSPSASPTVRSKA